MPTTGSTANQLRKWIAEALKGFVNWDWEVYRPLKTFNLDNWFEWIYIPQAAGNQGRSADEAMVAVCLEVDLLDASKSAAVQSALIALIRFHAVHNCSWDYRDADMDLPRYSAFLEGTAKRARNFARRRYFKPEWDPIPALVQGLLIGARALGVEAATKDRNHGSLIQSLFAAVPTDLAVQVAAVATSADATDWVQFTNALRQRRRSGDKESRDQLSWQGHLLNLVGARQGQADTVHAIDVMRLKPAIEETVSTWALTATLPTAAGATDFASFRSGYAELKRLSAVIPKAQERLFGWRKETVGWLGDVSGKEALVREMKDTVEAARADGIAKGLDAKGLLQLLEDFRSAKVVAALDDAAKLDRDAARGIVLTVLGRGHEPVARLCKELGGRLETFLTAVEAELASEAMKYGADPLQEAVAYGRLKRSIEKVRKDLASTAEKALEAVNRDLPSIEEGFLKQVELIPAYAGQVARIREQRDRLQRGTNLQSMSAAELDQFLDRRNALRALADQLNPEEFPKEVLDFFKAARHGGAPLDKFTPTVREWLSQRDQLKNVRVSIQH